MNSATRQKIERLVSESFHEIAEHACQEEVISPHIKNIKNKLTAILGICQAELATPPTTVTSRARLETSEKSDILLLAYVMSRFDYQFLNHLLDTSFNQSEALAYLEKLTGVKATTLKNMRDRFDPYVRQERSNRRGWHQAQLLPDYQEIKDQYDEFDEEALTREVERIIHQFRSKN